MSGIRNQISDIFTLQNSNNISLSANTVSRLEVGGTAAGSPMQIYAIPSGTTWTQGVDNADSDTFKVCKSDGDLTTNNYLKISTSGAVSFPTEPLDVSSGGTGANTLTGLVLGNGVSAMTSVTYTSGTFSPTITLGGTPISTYFTRLGYWNQIGKLIFFQCETNINSLGAATGTLFVELTGLPVKANDGQSTTVCLDLQAVSLSASAITFGAVIIANTNSVFIQQNKGAGTTSLVLNETNVTTGSILNVSGTYYTD